MCVGGWRAMLAREFGWCFERVAWLGSFDAETAPGSWWLPTRREVIESRHGKATSMFAVAMLDPGWAATITVQRTSDFRPNP